MERLILAMTVCQLHMKRQRVLLFITKKKKKKKKRREFEVSAFIRGRGVSNKIRGSIKETYLHKQLDIHSL